MENLEISILKNVKKELNFAKKLFKMVDIKKNLKCKKMMFMKKKKENKN